MRARNRRRPNQGLTILLGIIVAVFVVVAAAVGIKYLTGSLSSSDGKKDSKKAEEKNTTLVKEIHISTEKETIRAGEETKLTVSVSPENASNKKLKWSVKEGAGSISQDGVFTPSVEAGKSTVEVTAKASDGSNVSASVSLRVLEAIDPEKPMVAVTYDDGPNPDTTPTVLDVLEKNYAVATFFMQGKNIEGNEQILERSASLGNELANHSWDHPQLSRLSADGIKKQLEDTDALIKAHSNEENPILRPPYGDMNDTVKSVCGKPIIIWSLDTLDWKTRSTQKTYESCMTAKDGDIILMHDIHATTVAAAEDIVTGLQEKGFQLVTVSELYRYRDGEFGDGTVHYSMTAEEMLKKQAEEAASTEELEEETDSADATESEDTVEDPAADGISAIE